MSAVAEKYARAISSSHLEWKLEPGAIDTLTAAGMIQETLGTGLLRLRAEFDSISTMPGSRSMIPRLKSAAGVRLKLLGLIIDRAPDSLDMNHDGVIEMAAKLLDHWCDVNCPACSGRGQLGAYGEPQGICNACRGSKRRSLLWPQTQQAFADSIAAEMESMVDTAQRRIRKLLRQE